MGFLIDTNVLSEMRKQARANANVLRWAASNRTSDLFLSALVIGEVRRGIEAVRPRDPVQARSLDTWLAKVIASFGPRILPITVEIADAWGRLSVPDRLPEVDGLLAATAIVHNLILVTRNIHDVARTGVTLAVARPPLGRRRPPRLRAPCAERARAHGRRSRSAMVNAASISSRRAGRSFEGRVRSTPARSRRPRVARTSWRHKRV